MNETLTTHIPAEIATMTLFLFQMAMLEALVSALLGKMVLGWEDERRTYEIQSRVKRRQRLSSQKSIKRRNLFPLRRLEHLT